MKNGSFTVGVGFLVLSAIGAGCAGEDGDDDAVVIAGMGGSPITAGGLGGSLTPPPVGAGAIAPPPSGGSSGGSGTAGTPPVAGGGGAGASGAGAGGAGMGGTTPEPDAGMMMTDGGMMGAGDCCPDGDCLCHGEPPATLDAAGDEGPFMTDSYDLRSAGCIYFPTNAEPPFAAVAISDGAGGVGGCGRSQTSGWGPLYASWGIVAMIIHTTGGDSPTARGTKLSRAIEAYKMENMNSGSMLFGKLSGRYGTSGFSMGGGGTTYAAQDDATLRTNVSLMAWQPARSGITVPSLFIFGSGDGLAGTMGMSSYRGIADTVPKMAVTVSAGHSGQPSAGSGDAGAAGVAFQKVFLEGDTRWRPLLLMVDADESTIK
jgi:hypothetical protein